MKERSNIKAKNEQKLLRIWKGLFLLKAPLFTLKILTVLKIELRERVKL